MVTFIVFSPSADVIWKIKAGNESVVEKQTEPNNHGKTDFSYLSTLSVDHKNFP